MKLSKKFDGKYVTIRANAKSPDNGTVLTGLYRHESRRQSFAMRRIGEAYEGIYSRDEWDVLTVADEVEELSQALKGLLKYCCDGRRYETQNPYTVPEIRQGLKILARQQRLPAEDYYEAKLD
jgi:hypothetical protein